MWIVLKSVEAFLFVGRLRVNMGNIYVEQRKYPQAIKMYRMALDQIQDSHKGVRWVSPISSLQSFPTLPNLPPLPLSLPFLPPLLSPPFSLISPTPSLPPSFPSPPLLATDTQSASPLPFRLKILQNIGTVFVRMGQYADAITSFEHIMEEQPDFKAGLNIRAEYSLKCFVAVVCIRNKVYILISLHFQWLLSWLLHEWKGYLVPTWAWKITCQRFAPVIIRAKVKRCEQTLLFIAMHYWGYTSLEVKGRWGLLLPPCLLITAVQQPGTSSPPSRLKRSSEGVIWMCRASFTNSSCPLLWSSTVVSSQWIEWWFSHTCSATVDFSIIPLSQASRCSFSLVSSLRLVSPM